jgi:hypothetical protein
VSRKSFKFVLAAAAVLALVVALTARNRDRTFEVFVGELDGVADEVVKVIAADPTAAGVAKARETLRAKKEDLKAKLVGLNALTAAQAGNERLTQFQTALMRNHAKINDLFEKEIDRRKQELRLLRERTNESRVKAEDPAVLKAQQENKQFVEEMRQLLDEYNSIID